MSAVSEFNQENGKSEQSVYQIGILSVHFRWIFVRFLGPENYTSLHAIKNRARGILWPGPPLEEKSYLSLILLETSSRRREEKIKLK